MSKFTLVHETPDHFVIHNGISHFHVAKKGIDQPTSDKIRSFAQGGKTTFGDKTKEENEALMKEVDSKIASKNYAEGGKIEHNKKNIEQLDGSMHKFLKEEETEKMASGGKLDANARKHIAGKNFAGPDRSYPIEDASHARNALARVSQHGSPELKAEVREKVHSKYPGIEQSKDQGGQLTRNSTHSFYDDGGTVEEPTVLQKLSSAITSGFEGPKATPTPAPDHEAEYAKVRAQNTKNFSGGYASGGDVKDISNETQTQAIKRYADGNPATLSKGGHVHNNAGKNQVHLHFYDGAIIPTQLDKEEGAVPQQPSALDSYVGGEPAQETPLDEYVKMADGGETSSSENSSSSQPLSDSDKLAQAAQDIQSGLNAQVPSTEVQNNSSAPPTPVSPSQQISAVQKPSAPSPDQNPSLLSDFDKNLQTQEQGIKEGANAQSQGYQQTAQAIGENALQQKAQMDAYKVHADQLTAQNEQLFNDVASNKIDPNHFWNSKTTGGKIMASIGVLLGGIGGGANGTNQNQALAALQNHIQQDIEAQKDNKSTDMNLYKMGLEKYKDAQSAQQFATLQSNALLQGQLQKIAALTGNPQAQATSKQLIGQIGVQNAGLRSQLAMQQAAYSSMNQPTQSGVDTNKLRLLINAGIVPKENVPDTMKEFGDYQKLSNSLDEVKNVFNQARQDSTYTQRIADAIPGGSLIPTVRDSSKDYLAETNALLDKYTKDLTGRVTPQSMQNLRHSIPVQGDSPHVVERKLSSFQDIVRQAYKFPNLITNHLLSPTDPVITSSGTRARKFNEQPPK